MERRRYVGNSQCDFTFLLLVRNYCVLSAFFFLSLPLLAPRRLCAQPLHEAIVVGASRGADYLPLIDGGKRVGLVCNQTSRVGQETDSVPSEHLVDYLLGQGVDLRAIFTPEHGFRGTADAGEYVQHSELVDRKIRIISLYGANKELKHRDLEGIDVVLFDLQDVGVRCYTYISTLHYVMQACAEMGKMLIVLDRPNPNGHYVDGPVLDPAYASFVGMHPVPWVHGMTIGEYAQMINGEKWLKGGVECPLTVIPCLGYTHETPYVLPIPPSPNLRSQNAVYLYPSLAWLEGTRTSVARGTDFPFEAVGSPRAKRMEFSFVPKPQPGAKKPKYMRRTCYGVDLRPWRDSSWLKAARLRLDYLVEMYNRTGRRRDFFNRFFDQLAGTTSLRMDIEAGKTPEEIRERWHDALDAFRVKRAKYLLYPDVPIREQAGDTPPLLDENPEDNRVLQ